MDSIGEYILSGGKIKAFFVGGAFVGFMAFVICMALFVPFVIAGWVPFVHAYYSAIGCGFGAGLVNAIFLAAIAE